MAFVFSKRSKNNLKGVHPDLIWVCSRALILSPTDYIVTEGLRTYERQVQLKNEGKSKTLNSKHLKQADGYGHAFDIVALIGGDVKWDTKYYPPIVEAMKKAAAELGVKITCGYDWPGHWDPYHVQIDNPQGIRSLDSTFAAIERAAV